MAFSKAEITSVATLPRNDDSHFCCHCERSVAIYPFIRRCFASAGLALTKGKKYESSYNGTEVNSPGMDFRAHGKIKMTSQLPQPAKQLHIPAQTGTAFTIKQGQTARIIDVTGGQVADLFCIAEHSHDEVLSSGHTIDYNGKIFFSEGDVLYSSKSNPMLRITTDRVGKHIMLYAPCSQEMFAKSYGATEMHPNCFENLTSSLVQYGVRLPPLAIPLNLFMNIEISQSGKISILPPRSTAGDYVDLRAEMDLVVGVSACAAGVCNDFSWTPIEVEIYQMGVLP